VAVVLAGNWDLVNREIPGLGGWRTIGDPVYDEWLQTEVRAATVALIDGGVREVVWLTLPAPVDMPGHESVTRFNEIVAEVVASTPHTRLLDYAGHLARSGDDAEMRPDGTHLSRDTAGTVARRWLVPLLVGIGHTVS
jgi:hypothetical protein